MSSTIEKLPDNLLKIVADYLNPRDVMNLSMCSKVLYNACKSDEIWESIFSRHFGTKRLLDDNVTILDFNNWDFKIVCYRIFCAEGNQEFHHLFCDSCDEKTSVETLVELKPSKARMNILSSGCEVNSGSSSESEGDIINIQELQRSVSVPSIQSTFAYLDTQNSSKTNLLVGPTVSASSFNDQPNDVIPSNSTQEILNQLDDNEDDDLGFTREKLQKRLQNLVKKSIKAYNGDPELGLPGNKTTKFALKYRT